MVSGSSSLATETVPDNDDVATPDPTSGTDWWKRGTFWWLLSSPFLYAGVGQLLGQDVDFDLQNYHFFDTYWLLVNHMQDAIPAQLQTYLSPILDIPFYYAAQHFPARLTGFLIAVVQGTAFPLLYLINRHFTSSRLVALGLAALGMFTAGALSEVGNIMGDTLVAPMFLAAILLGLYSYGSTNRDAQKRIGHNVLIAGAGGIAGLAAGLKLAELPIALGIAAAFPLVSGNLVRRVQKAALAGGAMVVGVLVSYGWWGYELATRYGNPLLPYMNQIFHSPYAPLSSNTAAPAGVFDILFYPIDWTLHPSLVSGGGGSFLEASLPMAELLLIALLALSLVRAMLERRYSRVFGSDKQRYLVSIAIISYLFWALVFNQYRFLIPIEMLSFTLIFIFLQAIGSQIGWRQPAVLIAAIAIALACIVSEQPMTWGRTAWSGTYFSVSVPKSLTDESGAFLMLGTNPDAYVVPYFPQRDYFAQVEGNLPPTPLLKRIIVAKVSVYRNVFAIWRNPVLPTSSAFADEAEGRVETYGFQIDWNACDRFSAMVGALSEEFHTCRLKRVSISKLAPTTQVLNPVGGDHLMGRHYLSATAFCAAGLRRVTFSIVGGGRILTLGATNTLVGWLAVWNTKLQPNGPYTIRSIAHGDNGLVTASAGVDVDVTN
jgi:hypothetical protein